MNVSSESTGKLARVVIIGGGFAGIAAAQTLAKTALPADIVVVSQNTCFQYYPSLYRLVVGASVNQVSIPLSKALPLNTTLMIDTYVSMDPATHTVTLQSGKTLVYDYLVLAFGSEANYFGIEGLEERSKSFLSIDKALALKKYFQETIDKAKSLSAEKAKELLHTIIVGAGPSGIELAGRLKPYLAKQAKKAGVNPKYISLDLLDSSARILPNIPEQGSVLVAKRLKKLGVNVMTNYGVGAYDDNGLTVTDKNDGAEVKKQLQAGTVIWTAGTKISPAFATIPNVVMTDRKRVQVSPTLTLPNDDSIYIAGDGAGTLYSGLAQTAVDQGKYVGDAIAKRLTNKLVEPYEPKPGIFVIPVGTFWAIFNYKNFVMSGVAAYFIRIAADAQYFLDITSLKHVFSMLRKQK